MGKSKPSEVELPAAADPKKVDREDVTLSERVVAALKLSSASAVLVERGEVESIVEVDGERLIVGNEEVL